MKKILIYGYGNPGRQDDGLGILLTEKLEEWATENSYGFLDFDSNYQLNIEDALKISEYDMVIFADASVEDLSDFAITRVEPCQKTEFTMHAMTPGFVLHLCHSLYNKYPKTYLVHLKGFEFDFLGELTDQANENLNRAFNFFVELLSKKEDTIVLLEQNIIEQDIVIKTNIS